MRKTYKLSLSETREYDNYTIMDPPVEVQAVMTNEQMRILEIEVGLDPEIAVVRKLWEELVGYLLSKKIKNTD